LNELTSSYAGAIGWAQFIPSSLNRLFIGKNMDFNADPFDMEDCIHSVAYYLNRSGWDPRREKNIYEGSRNWKALLAYNKSSVYVKAVLELSRSLDNYIRSAAASAKPSPEPDF
ncbi:lytic transglycosylase domain-containing protein, partial [Candidatus Woesearchaeota archaeon]|nr:lytic transglycosylase domain-containing protein [Candidatus Woesearchaeota archaeon]